MLGSSWYEKPGRGENFPQRHQNARICEVGDEADSEEQE